MKQFIEADMKRALNDYMVESTVLIIIRGVGISLDCYVTCKVLKENIS